MRLNKIYISMSLILFSLACAQEGDFSYELPNKYIVSSAWASDLNITPKDGWNDDAYIIPSFIVGIWWNETFICAKQHPLIQTSKEKGTPFGIPNEKINNYWIIDAKNHQKSIGPLSETEFIAKAKDFKLGKVKFINPNILRNKRQALNSNKFLE